MDNCALCTLAGKTEVILSGGNRIKICMDVKGGNYWIDAIGEGNANTGIKINYCPICGRHLDRSD